MIFHKLAILLQILLDAHCIKSQLVSPSFVLVSGKTSANVSIGAAYPSSYGISSSATTPGVRSSHRIIVSDGLVYSFHGNPAPVNDVWSFNPVVGEFTWISGRSNSGTPFYGTIGIASASITPGYRYSFCGDIRRATKEYFLFGGYSFSNSIAGDMWKFDLSSKSWTWLAGTSGSREAAYYGSKGVATSYTTPGARYAMACAIDPLTDEFLLFGGVRTSLTADFWAFNFDSTKWSWIAGSSIGNDPGVVYSKGEWSSGIYPRSREYVEMVYDNDADSFYIFGGLGTGSVELNDLWAFKRDSLEWAWISGRSTSKARGVCGTIGYASSTNVPGSRFGFTFLYHSAMKQLLLIGGNGYSCSGSVGLLSDIWLFDPSTIEWTWIAGNSTANDVSDVFGGVKVPNGIMNGASAVNEDDGVVYTFGGTIYLRPNALSSVDYVWTITFPGLSPAFSQPAFSPPAFMRRTRNSNYFSSLSEPVLTSQPASVSHGLFASTFSTTVIILMACAFLLFILLVVLVILRHTDGYGQKSTAQPTDPSSMTFGADLSVSVMSSTFTSTSSESTTIVPSSIGLYLPGGLLVDPEKAYRVEFKIAQGGGGSVWRGTAFDPILTLYGSQVIIKVPMANGKDLSSFQQEIALMNAFRKHENIVKLLGYSQEPFAIIMKYYPHGSLARWIRSGQRSMGQLFAFIRDISTGVSVLHINGIVHCDLKPDNILIDETSRLFAVLADFGVSRIVTDRLLKVTAYEVKVKNGASLRYAAPEALLELRNLCERNLLPQNIIPRDIFALGTIISDLMNGKEAWL